MEAFVYLSFLEITGRLSRETHKLRLHGNMLPGLIFGIVKIHNDNTV